LDGLLTSITNNGFYCDLPPPFKPLSEATFASTIQNLQFTWQDLITDNDIPGVAIGVVYDQEVVFTGA